MNITFMAAISITISSMAIVLLTLALIAILLSSFSFIFKEKKKEQTPSVNYNTVVEDDEDDRLVACLAASAMAGNGKINPNLHIRRVTRIK